MVGGLLKNWEMGANLDHVWGAEWALTRQSSGLSKKMALGHRSPAFCKLLDLETRVLSSRGSRVLIYTTGWQGFVNSLCVAVARIPKRNLQEGKIYLVHGFEGLVYILGSVDSEPVAWLSIT